MPLTNASIPSVQTIISSLLTDPKTGQVSYTAASWFRDLMATLSNIIAGVNSTPGVNRFLLANQPNLGAGGCGLSRVRD